MAMSMEEVAIVRQIDDLRDRMKILQNDRKVNMEIWETSKKANLDEIRRLREENKEFRQQIAVVHRSMVEETDKDEVRHLESEVDNLRRTYDTLQIKSAKLQKVIAGINDSLKGTQLEGMKPQVTDNSLTQRIRTLENKLDTYMIKFNETQGIKQTYEQMVSRLRDEQLSYENEIKLLEKSVFSKQRDFQEIKLVSNDASHAKEVAYNELERIKNKYIEDHINREKQLREKAQVIQLRKQLLLRNKEREKLRHELIENEKLEKNLLLYHTLKDKNDLLDKTAKMNKLNIFEEAFRKMRDATGVSNVNEVIDKILNQNKNTQELLITSRNNQTQIELLHQKYRQLKIELEDIKYNAASNGNLSDIMIQKELQEKEKNVTENKVTLENLQHKYEKCHKLMNILLTGTMNIIEQMKPISHLIPSTSSSGNSSSSGNRHLLDNNNNNNDKEEDDDEEEEEEEGNNAHLVRIDTTDYDEYNLDEDDMYNSRHTENTTTTNNNNHIKPSTKRKGVPKTHSMNFEESIDINEHNILNILKESKHYIDDAINQLNDPIFIRRYIQHESEYDISNSNGLYVQSYDRLPHYGMISYTDDTRNGDPPDSGDEENDVTTTITTAGTTTATTTTTTAMESYMKKNSTTVNTNNQKTDIHTKLQDYDIPITDKSNVFVPSNRRTTPQLTNHDRSRLRNEDEEEFINSKNTRNKLKQSSETLLKKNNITTTASSQIKGGGGMNNKGSNSSSINGMSPRKKTDSVKSSSNKQQITLRGK